MSQSLKVKEVQQSDEADWARVAQGVRAVAAKAASRGEDIDEARAFPRELFTELADTGAFEALMPRAIGGIDMPLALLNELVIDCARANGSMGWLMMVSGAQALGFGFLPESTMQAILRQHEHPRIRGAIAPKGTATPVEGGYIINGRWPFASGGPEPHYIAGNCIVLHDGKPKILENGAPDAVIAMMPADKVKMLDTWYTLGMRGTDSCDVEVKDVFVPSDWAYNLFTAKNVADNASCRLPLRVALSTLHVAVALGVAEGALAEIADLAQTKRQSMNPNARLIDDQVFRWNLGENTLRLASVRSMLFDVIQRAVKAVWDERREMSAHEILIGRNMAGYLTNECVKTVNWAFTAAGSNSVYDGAALQRRLRDIHICTQHASCFTDAYATLGKVALGIEVSPMELF